MLVNSIFNTYRNSSVKTYNRTTNNSSASSDLFVKSSNVSFSALNKIQNRQETVNAFMKDLRTQMYSPSFSLSDVSKTLTKYVKSINVKPMKQAPKELLFSKTLQGLYCSDLSFDYPTKKFVIPKKNRNFYVKTETFNQQFGNLLVYLNAVHEFTHILQIDDENSPQLTLFNNYVEKQDDLEPALEQITVVAQTVNKIEENVSRSFVDFLNLNQNLSYTRVQNGRTDMFDWICNRSKITNPDEFIKGKIIASIQEAEKLNSISIDKKLILDATIVHLEKEIEAYKNENIAHKNCLRMFSPLALTRIDLYEKTIKILNQMKSE